MRTIGRCSSGWAKMPPGICSRPPCACRRRQRFLALRRIRTLSQACNFSAAVILCNRWLPFSLTTVLVGADFIVLTSRIPGGLIDHVHQARAQQHTNNHPDLLFTVHHYNNHHLCEFSRFLSRRLCRAPGSSPTSHGWSATSSTPMIACVP
jgi:hypothetical protein